MFPSSHTAPLTYPLRDSATSTFLSSCFRTTLCLSSSSPLSPLSAPSESSLRSDLPPSKLLLSRTSNLQRLSIQTTFNLHFWDVSFGTVVVLDRRTYTLRAWHGCLPPGIWHSPGTYLSHSLYRTKPDESEGRGSGEKRGGHTARRQKPRKPQGKGAKTACRRPRKSRRPKWQVGRLPTHPTPAPRTGTSGTALEHISP